MLFQQYKASISKCAGAKEIKQFYESLHKNKTFKVTFYFILHAYKSILCQEK